MIHIHKDYSIKNTTRVQREKIVNDALGISLLGGIEPSEFAKTLVSQYIDGKMEIDEVQKSMVMKYKKLV